MRLATMHVHYEKKNIVTQALRMTIRSGVRTLFTLPWPYPPRMFDVGGSCDVGVGIGAATGPCRSRFRLLSRLAVGVGAKLPIGGSREVSARPGVCWFATAP